MAATDLPIVYMLKPLVSCWRNAHPPETMTLEGMSLFEQAESGQQQKWNF
jgi:hypothetical protein